MNAAAPVDPTASTLPPPHYEPDEPKCHCPESTSWESRRYDGTWEDGTVAQRTCMTCGASLSRVLP